MRDSAGWRVVEIRITMELSLPPAKTAAAEMFRCKAVESREATLTAPISGRNRDYYYWLVTLIAILEVYMEMVALICC